MGFSVSGSAALIFAAILVSAGAWYTATAEGVERVGDARADSADRALETRNARLNVTAATYDAGADTLTVAVENTGAAQLTLSGTDLLVDGRYVAGWQPGATVAGQADTDLWLAGETVEIEVSRPAAPDRVKVVAANGVADTAEVS
jgi:flagellar protein FlaF